MASAAVSPTPLSPSTLKNKQLWSEYGLHSTTVQLCHATTGTTATGANNQYTLQQYTTHRERLRTIFNVFSADGGATVSIDDIGTILRCLNQYVTAAELNKHILPLFAADGAAAVPYDKFEGVVLHIIVDNMYPQPAFSELQHAFDAFDTSGNGFLTVQQFADILKGSDELGAFTPAQMTELLRVLCDNDTQLIHYQDYVNATMQAGS